MFILKVEHSVLIIPSSSIFVRDFHQDEDEDPVRAERGGIPSAAGGRAGPPGGQCPKEKCLFPREIGGARAGQRTRKSPPSAMQTLWKKEVASQYYHLCFIVYIMARIEVNKIFLLS